MNAGRELDALVAEKVMGWRVERLRPEWYGGTEVLLFYEPGHALASYSYDERSCNACMYRNGADRTDGIAPPLPYFSCEIADAWAVVEKMRADGFVYEITDVPHHPARQWAGFAHRWAAQSVGPHDALEYAGNATGDTVAEAICRAALAAVGAEARLAQVES
jgi:hypothetical protein